MTDISEKCPECILIHWELVEIARCIFIVMIALKENMVMPDELLWAFRWLRIGLSIIMNCSICLVTDWKSYSLTWYLSGDWIASERHIKMSKRVLLVFQWFYGGVEVILYCQMCRMIHCKHVVMIYCLSMYILPCGIRKEYGNTK
jgi:hypothetical protein